MDGKFLDVYNGIVLDNFNAVVKQNFMFQTQLKFSEEKAKEVGELEKKLANCLAENTDTNILRDEIASLSETINQKNAIIQSSANADIERDRLQTAVNNQMAEIQRFKKTIEDLQKTVEDLNKTIEDLRLKEKNQQERIIELEESVSSLNKKKSTIESSEEQKSVKGGSKTSNKNEDSILKFTSNGGTF